MCGWGSTSNVEGVEGTSVIGPAWSMKINGPTIRRSLNGRIRFTPIPGERAASRALITSSIILYKFIPYPISFQKQYIWCQTSYVYTMSNNDIMKKLRVAMKFTDDDIIEVLALAD